MLFQRHMHYSVKLCISPKSMTTAIGVTPRQEVDREICPSSQDHAKHTKQVSRPQRNTGKPKLQLKL